MLTATNDYKGIVASTSRMWRGQLLDSNNTPLSCDIMGVEVHKGTRGRDYQIGTMFAPHFSGMIRNYTGTLMGETLQFQLGLDISGVTEWVTICTGTVYQVTENGDDLSFTAAGVLATAGELIITEQGTDITDIITDIETLTGVTVSAVGAAATLGLTGTLAQSMNGMDARTALQYIAGVFGGFVSEGADGGIVIGNIFSGTQVQVTDDEIQKLPDSSGSFDITGFEVIVTAGGVDASGTVIPDVSYTDGTVVLTSVNPYMTSTLFNSVKSYVTGLTVYAGSIDQTMGNPLIEPWDIVYNDAYSDLRGSEIVITYNGGVSCRITSELTTTEEVSTVQTGPMSAQISKIEDKLYTIQDGLNYFWVDSSGAHVTQVPKETFLASPQGGNTLIDSNGLQVRDGPTTLASFENTGAQIGQTGETHAEIDYHSLQLIDREGNAYFFVSDLRDQHGELQMTETFEGGRFVYSLMIPASDTSYTVSVNGIVVTSGIAKTVTSFTFSTKPLDSDTVEVVYTTTSPRAKAFTFGTRSGTIGPTSVAEGYQSEASGSYSHAEGQASVASGGVSHSEGSSTQATGYFSHAEGSYSIASGNISHAEGSGTTASTDNAHAEGDRTTASGINAHAEGQSTTASGARSHAQNNNTVAGYADQTAIGKYNDNKSGNLFEIGNGTSDNARSNAFEVATSGIPSFRNPANTLGTVFDLIYPVGSIYMSVNNTDPGLLFGGTWSQIQDTFLLAAGSVYSAGTTGGAATVKLTAAQSGVPAHTHSFTQPTVSGGAHGHTANYRSVYNGTSNYSAVTGTGGTATTTGAIVNTSGTHSHTVSGGAVGAVTGGAADASSAHNNMPPYLAVYIWKRTA